MWWACHSPGILRQAEPVEEPALSNAKGSRGAILRSFAPLRVAQDDRVDLSFHTVVHEGSGRDGAPMAKPVKVSITYCAECGYEPQTLALADALMRRFAHDLS